MRSTVLIPRWKIDNPIAEPVIAHILGNIELGLGLALFGADGLVVASDAPNQIKYQARKARAYLGDVVQVCDGTRDEVEIDAAIDAVAGGCILLLAGTYSIYKGIHVDQVGTRLVGCGNSTILSLAAMPTETLAANASSGQAVVKVTDASDFVAGEEVMMVADNYYGWYTISSVDTTASPEEITLTTNLAQAYTTANNAKIIGYGYPSFAILANDCEVSHLKVNGARSGRAAGAITYFRNGANDGSNVTPSDGGYTDGAANIGVKAACSRVKVHNVYFTNTPEHGLGIYGTNYALDDLAIYDNIFTDIGDKAILARFTGTGSVGNLMIHDNIIDGAGKVEQTDRIAANFSYGDGIQCHTTGPREVSICGNTINDVARSGIWIMYSDSSEVGSIIANNKITNWGQLIFHATDEAAADISGIHCDRANIIISNNYLDGGFTDASHRGAARCFGINYVPSVTGGGVKTWGIISGNIIKGCYGNAESNPSIILKSATDITCCDNVANDGDIGCEITGCTQLKFHDNNFGDTDIQLTNATHIDVKIHDNRAKYVQVHTSGGYTRVEVSRNELTRTTYGGLSFTPTTTDTLQSVILWCEAFRDDYLGLSAASTTGVHAAITGTGASQTITTGITHPEGRNVTITTTNNAAPSGTVNIKGYNARGEYEIENLTISAIVTVEGNVAFLVVTEIVIPAGVTASDTVSVGTEDKLGLTHRIGQTNSIHMVVLNGATSLASTSNEDITYHTYNCTSLNGGSGILAGDNIQLIYRSELNTLRA